MLATRVACHASARGGANPARQRPIRLITPFPPGGAADAIARITAEAMTSQAGQTVVVENRAGADGVLGVEAVARAGPDGATLGVFNVSFFTAIRQMMNRLPNDPDRDLTPISHIVTSTLLCRVEAGRASVDLAA